MRLEALLPSEVGGWTATKKGGEYGRGNLFDYMDGTGEVYLAYDFRLLLVREYEKTSAPRIVAEVYEMSSSEDAFGIFCHDQEGKPVGIGQGGVYALGLLKLLLCPTRSTIWGRATL